jgi:hypothetical protein
VALKVDPIGQDVLITDLLGDQGVHRQSLGRRKRGRGWLAKKAW